MTEHAVHHFTREELYQAVWLEPIRTLARRLGVSDVTVAKVCHRVGIPTPEAGYWMRRKSGRAPNIPKLPPRPLGVSDEISIGRGHYSDWPRGLSQEELLGPIPDPPNFVESLDEVRERAKMAIKHVPARATETHPLIRKLLDDDKARRAKQRASPYSTWDKPQYQSPLEKRRLQILNSLFLALQRAGAEPKLQAWSTASINHGRLSCAITETRSQQWISWSSRRFDSSCSTSGSP